MRVSAGQGPTRVLRPTARACPLRVVVQRAVGRGEARGVKTDSEPAASRCAHHRTGRHVRVPGEGEHPQQTQRFADAAGANRDGIVRPTGSHQDALPQPLRDLRQGPVGTSVGHDRTSVELPVRILGAGFDPLFVAGANEQPGLVELLGAGRGVLDLDRRTVWEGDEQRVLGINSPTPLRAARPQ